mgnify:CR=1 FL=1
MKQIRQFSMPKTIDPFTLLEMCRLVRSLEDKECLEVSGQGRSLPDVVARILASEQVEIVEQVAPGNTESYSVILTKKETSYPSGEPQVGCGCGFRESDK